MKVNDSTQPPISVGLGSLWDRVTVLSSDKLYQLERLLQKLKWTT